MADVLGQRGRSKHHQLTTNKRCVTSQMSEGLICDAAEAWNHADFIFLSGKMWCAFAAVEHHAMKSWTRGALLYILDTGTGQKWLNSLKQ